MSPQSFSSTSFSSGPIGPASSTESLADPVPRAVKARIPRISGDRSTTRFDQPNAYGIRGSSTFPEEGETTEVNSGIADISLNVSDVAIGDLVRKYEGVIFQRGRDTFWARLQESPQKIPAIEAEFDLNDLDPSDRDLAVEGAPIVWTLGYTEGIRRKQSILYVRRIPKATAREYEESLKHVKAMVGGIQWE